MRKSSIVFFCFWLLVCLCRVSNLQAQSLVESIKNSKPIVVLKDRSMSSMVTVDRKWNGNKCKISITNNGSSIMKIKEVVLFNADKLFAGSTPIYAEGFQLLSQTGGTLEKPEDLGYLTDRDQYKLAEPDGYRVVYNLLQLTPSPKNQYLLGFSSANRFVGKFYLSADTVKVVMDLENLEMPAGATWQLEEFFMEEKDNRNTLLNDFAKAIEENHPRLDIPFPRGWSSWAAFGPEVNAKNIYNNLSEIKKKFPSLKYVQIDDGYQANMGDWLTVGKSFDGGIKDVLLKIKADGFEPGIWVAPFICDSNSSVYKNHKDWLVKDSSGSPLRSDKVGFGGWRLAPWYVLDGTNPDVQKHFETLFSTMRNEWKCSYFKLDANYWGAIHGGTYYQKGATRTEAYRDGMKAILKGAGKDAYILGCNQPMWPSLGLITGARTSMDIDVDFKNMQHTGLENLYRSWQNNKLWWNDPDCLLLAGNLPENQYRFHASLLYATGGALLSGDDITKLPQSKLAILAKMVHAPGIAAEFDSDQFNYGWIKNPSKKQLVVLNWNKSSKTFRIPIEKPCTLINYFTGEKIGTFSKEIVLKDFAGDDGCVYDVK
jgi:alpha-galactosidase